MKCTVTEPVEVCITIDVTVELDIDSTGHCDDHSFYVETDAEEIRDLIDADVEAWLDVETFDYKQIYDDEINDQKCRDADV